MAFPLIGFLINLAIGIGLQVVGYLIQASRMKQQETEAVKDLEAPTAEANRPLPVPFGEVEIKGLNVISYADKQTITRKVKA